MYPRMTDQLDDQTPYIVMQQVRDAKEDCECSDALGTFKCRDKF